METDATAIQRLIEKDRELSIEKFTLAEIRNNPGLVKHKIREYLQTIMSHNLAKVDALYPIAPGFNILALTTSKGDFFEAIKPRHDCVHRNGIDRDGNELALFTRTFVRETADKIKAFVENIESGRQFARSYSDLRGKWLAQNPAPG